MGPLKSGCGRMEMPCLGRGPWGPFPAPPPNPTKVSGLCPLFCSLPTTSRLTFPCS